ncbi:hypothetical protein M231_01419 [Tremella mesenterica]|uniref:Uncharacterized protein n=1 Tax=Tremella mesenterica TaxID=5217 RepID=A0A4Q1BT78_TREME|nr:hypothetical protein M231_01419 [Tremella mesenterica]
MSHQENTLITQETLGQSQTDIKFCVSATLNSCVTISYAFAYAETPENVFKALINIHDQAIQLYNATNPELPAYFSEELPGQEDKHFLHDAQTVSKWIQQTFPQPDLISGDFDPAPECIVDPIRQCAASLCDLWIDNTGEWAATKAAKEAQSVMDYYQAIPQSEEYWESYPEMFTTPTTSVTQQQVSYEPFGDMSTLDR